MCKGLFAGEVMISLNLQQTAKAVNGDYQGENIVFKGCSTDSRNLQGGELFVALKGERFDAHDFIDQVLEQGASAVLVEHINNTEMPAVIVKDTRLAMGDLAKAWRNEFTLPVVAITGSNGKTTVKEMVAAILAQGVEVLVTKGNLNNDIGVPLTLFNLDVEHEYAVIEMGANHAGEIDYLSGLAQPQVAVITQCAPAHLEGFGSIQGVAEAKSEIFNGLSEDGVAIINADDDYADYWRERSANNKQISFAIRKPADVYATEIQQRQDSIGKEFIMHYGDDRQRIRLNVAGEHNVMNALAAAACVLALGINLSQISKGLETMQGVKGRLQQKSGLNDSLIIDDTYNANPTSLKAAMEVLVSLNKESFLVLGDMGELGDDAELIHYQAGQEAKELKIQNLYTVGELSKEAIKGFNENTNSASAKHFGNKAELVADLKQHLNKDSVVLVKGSRTMAMEEVVTGIMSQGAQSC